MSGIEIAGLALAVLPVLIPAVSLVKRKARQQPRQVVDFLENLVFETWFLQSNLKQLADGLTELPVDTREQLYSPSSTPILEERWKSDEVVRALRAHLDIAYDSFCATLAALLHSLNSLVDCKSLALSNPQVIQPGQAYAELARIRATKKPINNLNFRIRYAVSEAKKYDKILQVITRKNEQLSKQIERSFRGGSPPTEPSQLSEKAASTAPFTQLRSLMPVLYSALVDSWACDCKPKHDARFCIMQQRDGRRDSGPTEVCDTDHIYFDLLMSVSGPSSVSGGRWLETQLCVAIQKESSAGSTRGVHFNDDQNAPAVDMGMKRKVDKMCNTMMEAERHRCAPQILFDGKSLWHTTSKTPSRRSSTTVPTAGSKGDLSLADLLQRLKTQDKRILPVILANSLLYFCESPWLEREWSRDQIRFFPSPDQVYGFNIRRPYLLTEFRSLADDNEEESEEEALYRIHPYPSILALGKVLLEIELGSTIESHYDDDDLDDGQRNVNTDHVVALRLFKEAVCDTIYINYQRALSACLNCDFFDPDTMKPSMNDEGFRNGVFDNIVAPLQSELYAAYELRLDDLMS